MMHSDVQALHTPKVFIFDGCCCCYSLYLCCRRWSIQTCFAGVSLPFVMNAIKSTFIEVVLLCECKVKH